MTFQTSGGVASGFAVLPALLQGDGVQSHANVVVSLVAVLMVIALRRGLLALVNRRVGSDRSVRRRSDPVGLRPAVIGITAGAPCGRQLL